MMVISRYVPALLAWIGVAAHLAAAMATLRRAPELAARPLLPLLNLVVAACVLAYWMNEWYGNAARGITWYASDQALPAYACLVAIASVLVLTGRFDGRLAHGFQWFAFIVDAIVFAGAALYLTFARFDRLI
jgi:hypothetical protein